MNKFITIIITTVVALFALGISAVIAGIPLYYLWNWLMPDLFGFNFVTFPQAVGILFLSSILFKTASATSEK